MRKRLISGLMVLALVLTLVTVWQFEAEANTKTKFKTLTKASQTRAIVTKVSQGAGFLIRGSEPARLLAVGDALLISDQIWVENLGQLYLHFNQGSTLIIGGNSAVSIESNAIRLLRGKILVRDHETEVIENLTFHTKVRGLASVAVSKDESVVACFEGKAQLRSPHLSAQTTQSVNAGFFSLNSSHSKYLQPSMPRALDEDSIEDYLAGFGVETLASDG